MTRPARQATSLSRRNRIMNPIQRVGVVNWDCALPSTTFFGGYATKSLGEPKFRDRTPYYALDLDGGKIDFPERTQEAYDREMQYAIDAGIDYFAYCWYDRVPHQDHVDTSAAITVDAHVCELVGARMRHLQSPLRDALHLCAILINNHPYRDEELQDLAETMKEKCYEKIQGRPLAFFYTAPWDDVQGRLRTFCREAGVPDPFFVLMTPDAPPPPGSDIDALSAYACGVHTGTYRGLSQECLKANALRASGTFPSIPLFVTGWDPAPRIAHPVPWCAYSTDPCAPKATPDQLLEAAKSLKDWMQENSGASRLQHVLTFAWNEFEEGAWICPTKDSPTGLNRERLDAFQKVTELWRQTP